MRPGDTTSKFEVTEEGDSLKRFPKTLMSAAFSTVCTIEGSGTHHFVCQDTIDTVMVQTCHPVQALNLVISHFATLDD